MAGAHRQSRRVAQQPLRQDTGALPAPGIQTGAWRRRGSGRRGDHGPERGGRRLRGAGQQGRHQPGGQLRGLCREDARYPAPGDHLCPPPEGGRQTAPLAVGALPADLPHLGEWQERTVPPGSHPGRGPAGGDGGHQRGALPGGCQQRSRRPGGLLPAPGRDPCPGGAQGQAPGDVVRGAGQPTGE